VSDTRSGPGDDRGRAAATPITTADGQAQTAAQPLTTRAVAALARVPTAWLLLGQLMVALLVAGTVVWFLQRCWFPTIGDAIRRLPQQGALRSGVLEWQDSSPVCLAEGRFLAVVVDLDHVGQARSPAQVQVEFGRRDFKVYSLLGAAQRAYPRNGVVPFNRIELGPWWGAWAPAILAIAAATVVAGLMVSWVCLATLYCLPAWLIGFFANRDCSLGGTWRLSGAALTPGALLLSGVIVLYGWGALDLVRLAVGWVAHLVVGWVCLFLSILSLPRHQRASVKTNPFA
jgi:hypothetical protein